MSGAELLNELVDFYRRFVVMTRAQADVSALWAAHSHVFEACEVSPMLVVHSPEMRSGKSTHMKVTGLLAARPWRVVTPSEAVVFRKIHASRPTVQLDEFDAIFGGAKDYEPLRALLNAGNEADTVVPRCGGKNRDELIDFAIFSPKCLAGIDVNRLPATIRDRSVLIGLRRKRRDEVVEKFRRRTAREAAAPLTAELESWAERSFESVAASRPELPDELNDRKLDVWEPLFQLAEVAGGDWPERVRTAALEIEAGEESSDPSLGADLLSDIRAVFAELGEPERIASKDLVFYLAEVEERPWGEWGRSGKPITPTALARLLKPYRIRPKQERIDGVKGRGYERADFADAWERYLDPASSVYPASSRYTRDIGSTKPKTDGSEVVHTPEAYQFGNGHFPLDQAVVPHVPRQTRPDRGRSA